MRIKKRRYIQLALCIAALLVIGTTMLLNSPRVQQRVSVILATELENRIGTRVNLGGVYWLFPNDIVIDSLEIDDQEGERLLSVTRMAAKIEWAPLIKERQLSIRNIRLFNPTIHIYRENLESKANYQFLIDAFKSKEKSQSSKFNLRINSFIVRNAEIRHNVYSADHTPGIFNTNHLHLKDLSTHVSLKTLTPDSLNIVMRELSFREQSGLSINNLYFRLVGNQNGATFANVELQLPHSLIQSDSIWTNYDTKDFLKSLIVKGKLVPSYLTPSDIRSLVPSLQDFNSKLHFTTSFIGDRTRFKISTFECHTDQNEIYLQANSRMSFPEEIDLNIQKAQVNTAGWELLERQWPFIYAQIPKALTNIEQINIESGISLTPQQAIASIIIDSSIGNISTEIHCEDSGIYEGNLAFNIQQLNKVFPELNVTGGEATLHVNGNTNIPYTQWYSVMNNGTITDIWKALAPNGHLYGNCSSLQANDYTYQNLTLKCDYDSTITDLSLTMDDPYGEAQINAIVNISQPVPELSIGINMDSINLHKMNLITMHPNTYFSSSINSKFSGITLDDINGKLHIEELAMNAPGHSYVMEPLTILSSSSPQKKDIHISAPFIDGSWGGTFSYNSLLSSLVNKLSPHLPTVCNNISYSTHTNNLCTATFTINDTKVFNELFNIPIYINKAINITTVLNDAESHLAATINAPELIYGGISLSDIKVNCESSPKQFRITTSGTGYDDNNIPINAYAKAIAINDSVNINALWQSTPNDIFGGNLQTRATFVPYANNQFALCLHTDSSSIIINKSPWILNSFHTDITSDRVTIEDFRFSSTDQEIRITGATSPSPEDSLDIQFDRINLNYLLSLVKLSGIDFGGYISGEASVSGLYTTSPNVKATLDVEDFSFCEQILGDTRLNCHWDDSIQGLKFNALINDDTKQVSSVNGNYLPSKESMRLDINADSLNIGFLNYLLDSFMGDVDGHAYGNVLIEGPLSQLDMVGALRADASFLLKPTNVYYKFNDSIRFTPGKMHFNDITVYDQKNGYGILNGYIPYQHFNDFGVSLGADIYNLLGINLPETPESSFYTTVYGTGKFNIIGMPDSPLQIDIEARPEKGSVFALNIADNSITDSEAFITFTNRNSKRNTITDSNLLIERRTSNRPANNNSSNDLILNINANITPDMGLRLIMNPSTDDHISAWGNGDLQININNDNIALYGIFTAERGSYRLNLQNLISKNFEVTNGSTVNFEGDPMNAHLDITARHTVNNVPLKDLTTEAASMGNERVNCLLKIGGTLNTPTLSFDLELPQGTEEEKNLLRSYTSTDEQRNMQFVYLLGLGKFYSFDITQATEGTQGNNNMESFISSTISGQINNLLSNIINNDNWNISSSFRTDNFMEENMGPSENTWDNMEVEGILEGRMLNNRLLINGSFGYRNNSMYASNFIGDFDIRYLITPNGKWSVKGYNKTNDRYFSKTALNTQGIGLMFQYEYNSMFFPKQNKRKKSTTKQPEL